MLSDIPQEEVIEEQRLEMCVYLPYYGNFGPTAPFVGRLSVIFLRHYTTGKHMKRKIGLHLELEVGQAVIWINFWNKRQIKTLSQIICL